MKILIADDHPIIVEALSQIILTQFPSTKVFSTEYAVHIVDSIIKNRITHLILDIQLLDGNSLQILNDIKNKKLAIHIMVFTTTHVRKAFISFNNGQVWGFVHKNIPNPDLRKVISNFLTQKEIYKIDSEFLEMGSIQKLSKNRPTNIFDSLSKNEMLVMEMLADNTSVKEIAFVTNKKPNTISTYKRRLFQKLGIKNLFELLDVIKKQRNSSK